jgi:predicted Zn-dependent protease
MGGWLLLVAALSAPPPIRPFAQDSTILAGQRLLYAGRFEEAQAHFATMKAARPADPVGPVLEAATLIWWGEATGEETRSAESIGVLLEEGVRRARAAGPAAQFWLATALGYQARQAELLGSAWRAARFAKEMRDVLEDALARDSSCADCLLGLGVYDYALARSSALARAVARLTGMGGGDAERGLARMRHAAEQGGYTRHEARWVLAHALLRENRGGEADTLFAALAREFPGNPAFARLAPGGR